MIRALLFDLDGVLIDSEPVHLRHWSEILTQHGFTHRREDLGQFVGLRSESLVEWVRAQHPPRENGPELETLMDLKRRRFIEALGEGTGAKALPGADAFLRAQKAAGMRLALVTSTRLKTVGQIMMHFGWRNLFEVVVGGDHVVHAKPNPEPYLMAMQRLKIKPEEGLVFEDSIPGVMSAVAARLAVCALTTSHEETELKSAGASWITRDFMDVELLSKAIGNQINS